MQVLRPPSPERLKNGDCRPIPLAGVSMATSSHVGEMVLGGMQVNIFATLFSFLHIYCSEV
jgi:hypothetical protein